MAEPQGLHRTKKMFSYLLKGRRARPSRLGVLRTGRGLYFAALSCLALTASACGGGMSFSEARAAFRSFSECALIEDFPGKNMELKDTWLQNVVAVPDADSRSLGTTPGSASASSTSSQSVDEAYVVTGVVHVAKSGSPEGDLAILRVRKVLGDYKVVNWATNIDRKEKQDYQTLLAELRSNLYQGRCSW